MSTVTFVLVHGAFSNGAQWGPVARALVLRGHRALALDLPGHGLDARPGGMAGIGTADEVATVLDALRPARAHGPVVLVGHSRGGLAVTAATNAAPELVDHLVYVSAGFGVADLPSSYRTRPSPFDELLPSLLLADPAEVGELRVDLAASDASALDGLQDALLADGSRAELLAVLAAMDRRESIQVDEDAVRVDPGKWDGLPHTYVRLTEDRSLLPEMQDRLVAEADGVTPENPFVVLDLAASHFGALLHPEPLAERLSGLVARP